MSGDNKFRVVIAIDFGTSRSGYAYAFKDDKKVIGRTKWPDGSVPFPKTLTQILYSPEREVMAWGYTAREQLAELRQNRGAKNYPFFTNFKMDLVNGHQTIDGPTIDKANQVFLVVNLISDYLRKIKDMALQDVKGKLPNLLDDQEILWCLTIPAIWTDANKQLMRQAAIKAGIIGNGQAEAERLRLILEPEAAAVYVQKDTGHQLSAGSSYMIVDCGGGTVDITVHRLVNDTSGELTLGEMASGTGGPFGATVVDREFLNYLGHVLSPEAIVRYEEEEPIDFNNSLMTAWEQTKVSYDPTKNKDFVYFPLSSKLYKLLMKHYPHKLEQLEQVQEGIDDTIYIRRRDMEALFLPALDGLVETIQKQFDRLGNQSCDYIFLVGGFSTSLLLQQRIKKEFGKRVKKIITPKFPGAAIVEGAVTLGWHPEILPYRCSRLTYGCGALMPFRKGKDPESKKNWYPDLNDHRCKNRFSVFVYAGQKISIKESVKRTFSAVEKDQTSIVFKFYATKKRNVDYVDEKEVEHIGEMTIEMPDTTGGVDRSVEVTMHFGQTEIKVDALDLTSKKRARTTLRFSYTYSSELIGDY